MNVRMEKEDYAGSSLIPRTAELRRLILEICLANGGHLASSFSCLEILVSLYQGGILRINPQNPDWPERDRFVLSKGHAETALYAVLADCGFFPRQWLFSNYRQGDCRLGGHPDHKIAGVEVSTGALGHGLGLAVGMAMAAKAKLSQRRIFVLMGDAECTEGSVWEAAMLAARQQLSNLVAIIDRNRIGSIDYTENYTKLEPLAAKWVAFGWHVVQCDGHDLDQLGRCFGQLLTSRIDSPKLLLAHTVKGRGISFMENDPIWHVKPLKRKDQIEEARRQLQFQAEGACFHGHA